MASSNFSSKKSHLVSTSAQLPWMFSEWRSTTDGKSTSTTHHNLHVPSVMVCIFPTLSDREAREGNTFKFISLVREKTGPEKGYGGYAILEFPMFPKKDPISWWSQTWWGKTTPNFRNSKLPAFTTSTSTQRIQMKYQGPHPQDQPQLLHKLQVCASRI